MRRCNNFDKYDWGWDVLMIVCVEYDWGWDVVMIVCVKYDSGWDVVMIVLNMTEDEML